MVEIKDCVLMNSSLRNLFELKECIVNELLIKEYEWTKGICSVNELLIKEYVWTEGMQTDETKNLR